MAQVAARRRMRTGMGATSRMSIVRLPTEVPIWSRIFTVAPLVLVGTKEPDGSYDIAPKHMAMPLGWEDYYCFVCTPRHTTYTNVRAGGEFTVSFPLPESVVLASLAASERNEEGQKPNLDALATFPAAVVDGVLVEGCYLYLECSLDRVVEGFGEAGLVVGRVVAAHADERALRLSEGNDGETLRALPLLAYVSPGRFARVDHTDSFPFPVHFSR
jgi:flavin reductase (DIM6/NTAB) family NADH-FMN oxidoreductase RutF